MQITEITRIEENDSSPKMHLMPPTCESECQTGAWEACLENEFNFNFQYWSYHDVDKEVWEA